MAIIRAVFFDLGRTLLYPKAPWQPIYLLGYKALTNALIAQDIRINERTFPSKFADYLNDYYADRETTLRETGTLQLLGNLLDEIGCQGIPIPILRIALDAFYNITQSNWSLEVDAHHTLHALKTNDYKLALLSNAADDSDVQALIDKNNLRHYFNFIRSSSAAGYRKPHKRMFEEALATLNFFSEESLMIGDSLTADINGANKLGIYSVWINRRVNKETKSLVDIHPKAVIQELGELPKLLLELS